MSYDPIYYKEWYKTNREKVRATRRRYYLANRVRLIAKQVAWNKANRDRCKEKYRSIAALKEQQTNAQALTNPLHTLGQIKRKKRLRKYNKLRKLERKS